MKIEFTPKAADVYQVTNPPTNRNDVIIRSVGMICSTIMVLGMLTTGFIIHYKDKK